LVSLKAQIVESKEKLKNKGTGKQTGEKRRDGKDPFKRQNKGLESRNQRDEDALEAERIDPIKV